MPCRKSFFSPTLFKKNMARFWPVWGLTSLIGTMIPLWLLLGLMANRTTLSNHLTEDFIEMLYTVAAYVVPYITILYAILCAMLVWGYLMNARSVGLMHTLPADRTCLFVTGAASGMAMMLIPYVITGALVSLIALCWGFMDFKAVCLTALTVILLTVTYFGIATFCAMITGNIFAVPALYALLNFLSLMVTALFNSLYVNFFMGLTSTDYTISAWLSPPVKIAQNFSVERSYTGSYSIDSRTFTLHGLGTLALYAGVGAALLAAGWLLYRLRHSESAGDVMVFRWLRPVFRYGVAFLSALTVGRLLYVIVWESIFQQGSWYDAVPVGFCLAAGGALGYYIASMLLEKSLRVFRGSLRGVGAVCAGALVLTLWLALDPFGLQTKVPDAGDVARARISCNNMDLDLYAGWDDEYIQDVVDIHRAIVDDLPYIRNQENQWKYPFDQEAWSQREYTYLDIAYTMQNGSQLKRQYRVWIIKDRAEDPDTFDGKLEALVESDRNLREKTVAMPMGGKVNEMSVYNQETHTETGIPSGWEDVLAAVERDLNAGNIPRETLFDGDGTQRLDHYRLSIEMYIQLLDEHGVEYRQYRNIYIYPTMTETIQYLTRAGYLTDEELSDLQVDYLQNSTTAAGDLGIENWEDLTVWDLQELMDQSVGAAG